MILVVKLMVNRSFRLTRLTGISQTLYLQVHGHGRHRISPEALTLTAACLWLTNSLHSRPDDGAASRRLLDAALPLSDTRDLDLDVMAYNTSRRAEGQDEDEEDSDSESDRVPYIPHGCVFLRRIKVEHIPRLRMGGSVLTGAAFKFWFKMSYEDVEVQHVKTRIMEKKVIHHQRSTTGKQRRMITHIPDRDEPLLFNLGRHFSLPPPEPLDDGSDVENQLSRSPPQNIDVFLSQLWRQFLVDLISKSPNPQGVNNPSYIKLSTVERRHATEDLYKNLTLSAIFTDVTYKYAGQEDWERAFKWLFPLPGTQVSGNVQGYPLCPYYITWVSFVNDKRHSTTLLDAVRSAFWKRLRTLNWITDAQGDKMWITTKPRSRGYIRWPPSRAGPAPRILLNDHVVPVFVEENNTADVICVG